MTIVAASTVPLAIGFVLGMGLFGGWVSLSVWAQRRAERAAARTPSINVGR